MGTLSQLSEAPAQSSHDSFSARLAKIVSKIAEIDLDHAKALISPPPSDREQLVQRVHIRAAQASLVDELLYRSVIATADELRALPFDEFIRAVKAAQLADPPGFYRVPQDKAMTPADLELSTRLAAHWQERCQREGKDRLWCLPHLLICDKAKAAELLDELIKQALSPESLSIDRAESIVATCAPVVEATDEPEPSSDPLAQTFHKAKTALTTWKLFCNDYYRSARFYVRQRIDQKLASFADSTASTSSDVPWILSIHASGGMGKTMLLRHALTHHWLPRSYAVVRIDFDEVRFDSLARSPWLITLLVAQQLCQQGWTNFWSVVKEREQSWGRALRRGPLSSVSESSSTEESFAPGTPSWDGEVEFYARDLAGRFSQSSPFLVVLDTTEQPLRHGDAETFGSLLGFFSAVHKKLPSLRLVLAGRYDLFGRAPDGAERVHGLESKFKSALADSLKLEGFEEEDAIQMLRQCYGLAHMGDDVLREVFAKSHDQRTPPRALPFYLAMWGRDLNHLDKGEKVSVTKIREMPGSGLRYLLERVLIRIPDDEVRWLVRYSAITRRVSLEIAREVLMPVLAAERAKQSDAEDRLDQPNSGLDLKRHDAPIYVVGKPTSRTIEHIWNELTRYAVQKPEEGWIEPHVASGTFTLHPRVVEPLRALLREHPVWNELHSRALAVFTAWAEVPKPPTSNDGESVGTGAQESSRAPKRHIGDETWTQFMCEAVWHGLQIDDSTGQDVFFRALKALRPIQWKVAFQLAQVVLEDDSDSEESSTKLRLDSPAYKTASVVALRHALWMWALEEDPFKRAALATEVKSAGTRWENCSRTRGHLFRHALNVICSKAGAEMKLERAIDEESLDEEDLDEADHHFRSDAILSKLILARTLEQAGEHEKALSYYGAGATDPNLSRWSIAPISKRRMLIIQAQAMKRLGMSRGDTAKALESLLSKRSPRSDSAEESWLDAEELAMLRLSTVEAWQRTGQPKRALSLLSSGFHSDGVPPALIARASFTKARCLTALHLVPKAELALASIDMSTPASVGSSGEIHAFVARAQGTLLSLKGECATARAVLAEAYSLASSQGLALEAQRTAVTLGRHLVEVEENLTEAWEWSRLHAQSQDWKQDLEHTLEWVIWPCSLRLAIQHKRKDEHSRKTELFGLLEQVNAGHPDPVVQAAAMALLVAHRQRDISELLDALRKVTPASARVLCLSELKIVATGADHASPRLLKNLFQSAFEDEALKPQGASPVRLKAAELYRSCGAADAARHEIEFVIKAARQNRNPVLWHEATLAARRLAMHIPGKAAHAPRRSALELLLMLEHSERESQSASSRKSRVIRQAIQRIDAHPALAQFAGTGIEARIEMLRASALTGDEASAAWAKAAARWESLGQAAKSEFCRQNTSVKGAPVSEFPTRTRVTTLARESNKPDSAKTARIEIIQVAGHPRVHQTFVCGGKRHGTVLPNDLEALLAEAHAGKAVRALHSLWRDSGDNSALVERLSIALRGDLHAAVSMGAKAVQLDLKATGAAVAPWELLLNESHPPLFRSQFDSERHNRSVIRQVQHYLSLWQPLPKRDKELLKAATGLFDATLSVALTALGINVNLPLGAIVSSLVEKLPSVETSIPVAVFASPPSTARRSSLPAENLVRAAYSPSLFNAFVAGDEKTPASFAKHRPQLIHIACPVEDLNDSGDIFIRSQSRISVSSFQNALKAADYPTGALPTLVLDVQMRDSEFEMRKAILRRNLFCSKLWRSGLLSGIIGSSYQRTSSAGSASQRAAEIADLAARHASMAECVQKLRDSRWGDLAPTTALWTSMPELPVV